jgi:hypothetical protein
VDEIVKNPLAHPRMEQSRVGDDFAAVKRVVWSALQAARQAARQASNNTIQGGGQA